MKGICFIEPLFHKVVSGEKTQTRRIIKFACEYNHNEYPLHRYADSTFGLVENGYIVLDLVKPRYKVGEMLYLKEPYFVESEAYGFTFPTPIVHYKFGDEWKNFPWKNKLFMPEKYARYFIEVLSVRAERLQDIFEEDCLKEGIYLELIEDDFYHYHDYLIRYYCSDCEEIGRKRLIKEALADKKVDEKSVKKLFCFNGETSNKWIREELDDYCYNDYEDRAKTCDICGKALTVAKNGLSDEGFKETQAAYAALIDSINGKGTWKSNPYVFVYDFKLKEK